MDDLDKYIESLFNDDLDPELFSKKQEYKDLLSDYLGRRHRDISEDYSDLIPTEFEVSDDIDTKIKTLKDSLEKGEDITESTYYGDIVEGPKGTEPLRRV